MPYIKKDRRQTAESGGMKTCGELNYYITDLICLYMYEKGLSYQSINDVIGALEGAKTEFYRRVAEPYEDKKIEENGDVYPQNYEDLWK